MGLRIRFEVIEVYEVEVDTDDYDEAEAIADEMEEFADEDHLDSVIKYLIVDYE